MIHFLDFSNEKMVAKAGAIAEKTDILLGNLEDAIPVDRKEAARQGLIKAANESDFGLAASILTGDPYRGLELAATLDAGIVHVNDQPVNDEPQMPFGGMKDSGWGRFGIGLAAEDFTELQWLTSRSQPRTFPF
jgi:hypothetical protein